MERRRKDLLFVGGFLLLMVLGIFLDLPLSKVLYNKDSPFGHLFEAIGEVPCMLVAAFSSAALWATRSKKSKAADVAGFIGFGLLTVLFSVGAAMFPAQYAEGLPNTLPFLGLVLAAGFFMLALKMGKAQGDALRKVALVGLLMVVLAIVGVNLIKFVWGRPRMRMMTDPDTEFLHWFMPKPFAQGNEYMSFPSGHSANAACILWITLLPVLCPRLRTPAWKGTLWAFAALWMVCVMVSRIIMGAHFFTDVLCGAGITLALFTLLKRRFILNEPALGERLKL